jgi:hypothetical protein
MFMGECPSKIFGGLIGGHWGLLNMDVVLLRTCTLSLEMFSPITHAHFQDFMHIIKCVHVYILISLFLTLFLYIIHQSIVDETTDIDISIDISKYFKYTFKKKLILFTIFNLF